MKQVLLAAALVASARASPFALRSEFMLQTFEDHEQDALIAQMHAMNNHLLHSNVADDVDAADMVAWRRASVSKMNMKEYAALLQLDYDNLLPEHADHLDKFHTWNYKMSETDHIVHHKNNFRNLMETEEEMDVDGGEEMLTENADEMLTENAVSGLMQGSSLKGYQKNYSYQQMFEFFDMMWAVTEAHWYPDKESRWDFISYYNTRSSNPKKGDGVAFYRRNDDGKERCAIVFQGTNSGADKWGYLGHIWPNKKKIGPDNYKFSRDWWQEFKSVDQNVESCLKSSQCLKNKCGTWTYFVGSSMGGALAELGFEYFRDKIGDSGYNLPNQSQFRVVTAGAPLVIKNKIDCKYQHSGNRYYTTYDAVPHKPGGGGIWSFYHMTPATEMDFDGVKINTGDCHAVSSCKQNGDCQFKSKVSPEMRNWHMVETRRMKAADQANITPDTNSCSGGGCTKTTPSPIVAVGGGGY